MILRSLYLLFFINVAVICFNSDDITNETQINKENIIVKETSTNKPLNEVITADQTKSENDKKSRLTMI